MAQGDFGGGAGGEDANSVAGHAATQGTECHCVSAELLWTISLLLVSYRNSADCSRLVQVECRALHPAGLETVLLQEDAL